MAAGKQNKVKVKEKTSSKTGKVNKGKQLPSPAQGRKFNPFRIFLKPWFWRAAIVVALVGILYWQWSNLTRMFNELVAGTMGLFGWGLILVAVAVLAILVIIFRARLAEFARRWKLYQWNKWLGAAAWFAGVWAMLAVFDLGGSIGDAIIAHDSSLAGWFIAVGLLVFGFILLFPGLSWRSVKRATLAIVRSVRLPAPKPRPQKQVQAPLRLGYPNYPSEAAGYRPEKPAATGEPPGPRLKPPSVFVPPEIHPSRKATAADYVTEKPPTRPPAPSPSPKPSIRREEEARDLKQVAQDVWRKYGESSDLVVVNGWKLPPIDILDLTPDVDFSQADNEKRARLIEEALDSYGVEARVVQTNAGPTVTQFGVEPGWDRRYKEIKDKDEDGNTVVRQEEVSRTRVKVERITALANNLALALAVPGVRIEAPIPGKALVGIEVPNTTFGVVSLRGTIQSSSFQKILSKSNLALALGKGAGGEAIAGDLAKMPHLLIAGSTGSGKTVCLNSLICCLLIYNSPVDLKLILIDPKRVELTQYNSLPHLSTPVVVDTDKALNTLRWLNQEMDRRYKTLASVGARNLESYNRKVEAAEKMPNLVLVIDELADLMMTGFAEVEHIICRLAQLARAVGIHLVVATQRPSVDVITGLIKANFPTRISFAVTSQVDSRTILDGVGAEKLLGRGDMLYLPTEEAKPKRLQGCFVSDPEVERLVYFWGTQKQEQAASLELDKVTTLEPSIDIQETTAPADPLMRAARDLAEEHTNISTSFLQRKLHIGYPRAARLMEQLQQELDKGGPGGEGAGKEPADY